MNHGGMLMDEWKKEEVEGKEGSINYYIDKSLHCQNFVTVDDMQMAACFIRRYIIRTYGNMIYLERVDRHIVDGCISRFVGHLSCFRNVKDGDGWKPAPPFRYVGTVEVDMLLRVIKASTRDEVNDNIGMKEEGASSDVKQ
jgi:hypothetical protein